MRIIKKIGAIIVVVFFAFVHVNMDVRGESPDYCAGSYQENDVISACNAADEQHSECTVEFAAQVYDINYNPRYIYLDYGTEGYSIYDIHSGIIIESGSVNKGIYQDPEDTYIYNGPFEYYRLNGDCYINQYSENYLDEIEVIDLMNVSDFAESLDIKLNEDTQRDMENEQEEDITLSVTEISMPNSYSGTDYYISNYSTKLPMYSQFSSSNFYNCCGSVAAAMWLMYMDKTYNDNYVPNNQETGNGSTLIYNLIPIIEPIGHTGSTATQVRDGVGLYFYLGGINRTMNSASFADTTCRNLLKYNIPVMANIDLSGSGAYGHWVVVWRSYIEGGVYKYQVRDGGYDPALVLFHGLTDMVY